jgi:DNA-binding transcriptional ArsR family regulator
MLKLMLEQARAVDRVFHALADETRRGLLDRLSRGPASVSELAEPLDMSLAAVVQHVQVLEKCGVITTRKVGRVRTCELDAGGLLHAERWIAARRRLWEGRLERLEAFLRAADPGASDPADGAPSPSSSESRSAASKRDRRTERNKVSKKGQLR